MPKAILVVENVTAGYVPDLPILKGVSLFAKTGQITLIIGPNGAGKSTMIKAIAGLVPVSGGRILVDNSDMTGLRPDLLAAVGVAYVPQNDNVFRSLTIAQNLALAASRTSDDRATQVENQYDRFPALADKRNDKAGTLSGGQRQVLAIAMALTAAPRLILMDEPSAGLSPKAAGEVLEHARALTDKGVSILLVEQNVNQAMRLADHCYIFAEGRNQIDGAAQDLLNDPVVGEIYLGGRRVGTA
ncbi:MAG: ABC transporter ATP-binding protein [Pseudomonadota bacterium]